MEVGCGARLLSSSNFTISLQNVHICLVYDCLYPYTVGGAERWYRALAERLAAEGYEVTYVTLRQWDEGDEPSIPGVRIVTAGRAPSSTSTAGGESGRRFASGSASCAISSAREGATTSSIRARRRSSPCSPRVSLGGAAATGSSSTGSRSGRSRTGGAISAGSKGTIAWAIQRLATRVGERAFCFSRLHERRLLAEGFRGPVEVIGVYTGPLDRPEPEPAEPIVVFAGRHIPEKGVLALPAALGSRAGDRARAACGDPRRRAVEGGGRAAGGGGRAERRRRGAGLRLGGPRSRLDPPQPVPRASVHARGLRPRRGRGGGPGSPERRRAEPRQRRARARRGRRQRRRRALDRAGRAGGGDPPRARGRACAARLDRRLVRAERAAALAGELARDGDATPTGGAESARRLQPPPPRAGRDRRRRGLRPAAAPGASRSGSRPRDDAVPRRGRRGARTGAKASTSSRFGSIPGAGSAACSRSRRSCRAPFETAAPDLLHNLFNTAPVLSAVPQVTTIHDVDLPALSGERDCWRRASRSSVPLAARRSTRILTDSEASKSDIVRFLGVPAESVDVAPLRPGNPEGRDRPAAGGDSATASRSATRRSCSASLARRPHKNVPRLVEAFAQVPDGVLVIPGYPTGDERELDERIEELELADRAPAPGLGRRGDARRPVPRSRLLRLPLARRGVRAAGARGDAPRRARRLLECDVASRGRGRGGALLRSARRRGDRRLDAADPRRPASLRTRLRAAGLERAKRFSWDETARRTLACYRKATGA